MKFHCGETAYEKYMREWHKLEKKVQKAREWRKKFAWFPIKLSCSKECVFLERVWIKYPDAKVTGQYGCFGPRIEWDAPFIKEFTSRHETQEIK